MPSRGGAGQRLAHQPRSKAEPLRAVIDGDVDNGSLMAGQSVGMVTKEEPLADILATLIAEAAAALEARAG